MHISSILLPFVGALSLVSFVEAFGLDPLLKPMRPLSRTAFATTAIGGAVTTGVLALWWHQQQQQQQKQDQYYRPSPNSLRNKTILITGGTTGLGLESAKRLALGGANIIVTARSDNKGQIAIQQIKDYVREQQSSTTSEDSTSTISYKILDLANLQSIKDSVASWNDIPMVDVLMNNAGVMAIPKLEYTTDGFETQFQTNHLGHFVLTALLAKNQKLATNARIVNVASDAHLLAVKDGLLFDYVWKPTDKDYGAWKSYGQSKLANILFTQELQRRVDATTGSSKPVQWTVVSLHPGTVRTDLFRYWFGTPYQEQKKDAPGFLSTALVGAANLVTKSIEDGATTQVWLASYGADQEGQDVRGKYYSDQKVRSLASTATDSIAAERLWRESEVLGGVQFSVNDNVVQEASKVTSTL